ALDRAARNLLADCIGLAAGQSLLIVGENGPGRWYDPAVADHLAASARAMGAGATIIMTAITGSAADFPADVTAAMQSADHTLFLSRLGDQIRFCPLPGPGSKTVAYTMTLDYLAGFGRIPHGLMDAVHDRLVARLATARHVRITCPDGSDLAGDLPASESPAAPQAGPDAPARLTPFTVANFPVSIFPPLSAAGMSGTMALSRWLTSSSTIAYDGSQYLLEPPLAARIEQGRIAGFDGPAAVCARLTAHFERVGAIVGGDPWRVDSWHTGINPSIFATEPPLDDLERWGTVAFGSPRFTHFHLCGSDPGHIASMLIDATITIDDQVLWRDGRFTFLDTPDIQVLKDQWHRRLPDFARDGDLIAERRDIGV
ncbi:MAG: hypothetical protein RIC83_04565, partial [Alphaproteobacteria bacterium]